MAAMPALAGPTINRLSRQRFEPPILIRVPDVTVVRPARIRLGRRRLRRDRLAMALAPVVGLASLLAWGGTPARTGMTPGTAPVAPVVQAIVADPLPLAEPLMAPGVALAEPPRMAALAVMPAGYLIPDEEPGHPEGSDHANTRR